MVSEASHSARTLVLRLHALGDTVLATGIARALAAEDTQAVDVATEPRFAAVFRGLPFVRRIWDRTQLEAERPRYQRVIDLQGTVGSRRLAATLGPSRTVNPRSLARRWIVLWGDRWPRPAIPTAIERYAEAAGLDPTQTRCAPEVALTAEGENELRALLPEWSANSDVRRIGLLRGASRRTKEWPAASFDALGELLNARGYDAVSLEAPLGAGSTRDGSRLALQLEALKSTLARLRAVVTSDSGPMHVATALGIPTLAIFGSTVTSFGFRPAGSHRLIEAPELPCRPCGVHGRGGCWLGHWRCLRELTPGIVAEELERLLTSTTSSFAPIVTGRGA